MKCAVCKNDIYNQKYFYLAIRESPGYQKRDSLKLNMCSFKCLKSIVEDPAKIITELL